MRADGQNRSWKNHDRMAIPRLRHGLRANTAPCPASIFDQHRLAQNA
jgi:hypothetical protein